MAICSLCWNQEWQYRWPLTAWRWGLDTHEVAGMKWWSQVGVVFFLSLTHRRGGGLRKGWPFYIIKLNDEIDDGCSGITDISVNLQPFYSTSLKIQQSLGFQQEKEPTWSVKVSHWFFVSISLVVSQALGFILSPRVKSSFQDGNQHSSQPVHV